MTFDIPLDLYKIFCMVVRKGNMSAAAKELFISQPAVSMSIRQLEERLGKPLLLRSPKGIKTTMEGSVLFEYINQALGLIDTAEKKYQELMNLENGEVRIGASDTLSCRFLMPYIERFIGEYPPISIKVTNRTTFETVKLLKSGAVDIGFINLPLPEEDPQLEIIPCLTIHDCLVGGSMYARLRDEGLSLRDLRLFPLLLLEKESNTRCYLDDFAQENGVILEPNVELGSSDLLVRFARINLGLAFVIREFTVQEIDGETMFEIPLDPSPPPRSIGLVKLKDVALSYAAGRFRDLFESL